MTLIRLIELKGLLQKSIEAEEKYLEFLSEFADG